MNKKILFSFLAIVLMASPLLAAAQGAVDGPTEVPTVITSIQDVNALINNLISWMQYLLFALAALFIVMAAFTYLLAGGDPEKTVKAKNQVVFSIIAIAIALLATGIVLVIKSFFLA
ncbi:MAG: TrbC/VirB2 family protein [bacterium]|nr:TrbC/VirB2 family protein [bacterium]